MIYPCTEQHEGRMNMRSETQVTWHIRLLKKQLRDYKKIIQRAIETKNALIAVQAAGMGERLELKIEVLKWVLNES
jgi:hypothetical protein